MPVPFLELSDSAPLDNDACPDDRDSQGLPLRVQENGSSTFELRRVSSSTVVLFEHAGRARYCPKRAAGGG
jgi:hypothetical protein